MKKNKKILRFYIGQFSVILMMAVLSGCRTTGITGYINKNERPEKIYVGGDIRSFKINKVIGEYHDDDGVQKFHGYILAEQGTGIQASFRSAMGIEVIRMWLTNDSIVIMNRIERNYIIVKTKEYLGECGKIMKPDAVSSGILGKFSNYIKSETNFIGNEQDDSGKIYVDSGGCIFEIYTDSEKLLDKSIHWNKREEYISVLYSGSKKFNNIWFPETIGITMDQGRNETIKLMLENIEINPDIHIEITIPKGYRKI